MITYTLRPFGAEILSVLRWIDLNRQTDTGRYVHLNFTDLLAPTAQARVQGRGETL